ncbi:aldehyde ferredoxin oxidoreductase N-terminal domain-containing protein [Nitratifractor sp.]
MDAIRTRGYAGKILHLRLDRLDHEVIPTECYVEWGGGNGMGTALFWDYCPDKTLTDGRDPRNVIVIATSPLSGTSAPSAGGRCELVGIGCGHYPIGWFTRSNIGGRLSSHMKYAGWDAVVISGKAPHPVWVEVENDRVIYHDARPLWGEKARKTQLRILAQLDRDGNGWGWQPLPGKREGISYTTQKPAVICIGPAGERQSVHAALVHDAGNTSAQGGFAAVFGAKNLKAISFLGTGSVKVRDPMALVEARFRAKERYGIDVDNPDLYHWGWLGRPGAVNFAGGLTENSRLQSCAGCIMGCRTRFDVGYGNETKCQATQWYAFFALDYYKGDREKMAEVALKLADYCNDVGINTYTFATSIHWLERLWHKGLLGKGKKIHTDLDFDELGSERFGFAFVDAFAYRKDIGEIFADGFVRGAIRLGLEEEWKQGYLDYPYWGIQEHGYDSRAEVEWGYVSILTDRDINSHDFNAMFWAVNLAMMQGVPYRIEAGEIVRLIADKLKPYVDTPDALDYSGDNIYSDAVMQLVRWYIHYNRFWKNTAQFCDLRWADLFDTNDPGNVGATADKEVGEQVYWNTVTGEGIDFVEGLRRGQRIYLLQNAIWALQGRHRDMVHFADYIYEKPAEHSDFPFFMWPTKDETGTWRYTDLLHRKLDREKFEDFKTRFYAAEGLDPSTGWPTRATLEAQRLGHVADELAKHGKLGKEGA